MGSETAARLSARTCRAEGCLLGRSSAAQEIAIWRPSNSVLVAPVSKSKSEARRTAQVGCSESIGKLEPINSDSSVVFRSLSQARGS